MALATTTISGLVSGLDTASIIQQMMSIERRPINMLKNQMAEAEAQKSAFTTINTSLLALKTIADEMASASTWMEKASTVSDESVLSATVSSDTLEGTYKFTVSQLATATQLASNGYADRDTTAVGVGSFDLTVNGTTETINVGAADTLNDVAMAINLADMGVTAVVVDTGSGAQPYKLIINSNDTGMTGEATVSNNTSGLAYTEITQAKNAIIQFGEDSPIVVESSTNTVTGLANGLTLDLKAVSANPVTVTVTVDTTGIIEKARDFAEKYNEVQKNITKYTEYSVEAEQAALLFGNSTLRFISSDLARAVGDSVADVDLQTNSLTMVGFKLAGDGTLELDEEVFKNVIDDNLDGVIELFTKDTTGVGSLLSDQLEFVTRGYDGAIAGEQESLDNRIRDYEDQISDFEDRLLAKEERLRAEFMAMEMALQQMQSQANFFLSQLAQTPSSSK
jgi:flagellar hook-associated protein 2